MTKQETPFAKADRAFKRIRKIREKASALAHEAPAKIYARAATKVAEVLAELDEETRELVEGKL